MKTFPTLKHYTAMQILKLILATPGGDDEMSLIRLKKNNVFRTIIETFGF